MFSDAEAQVKEIDLLLNDMAGSLRKVRSVGSSDKKERLKECAAYAQRVKTAKDAVVLELRQLDPEEAAPIKELMKEKMEKFTQLLLEYEHKKNEAVRDDIAAEEDYGGQSPDVNQMDREQLVQYADGTQDKAQEALDRTQQMVRLLLSPVIDKSYVVAGETALSTPSPCCSVVGFSLSFLIS
eukprot:GHVU01094667.1.p1 GENE.GHVU01094667.1~~GHVU01094667.1.p1  ORF type:complete len:183 (-),score=37.44 GHVU01094667.1:1458-2006(-)